MKIEMNEIELRQTAMAKMAELLRRRSEFCTALRDIFGSKALVSIIAFCAPITAGLLHASEQGGSLPQDGGAQPLSAELLSIDEEVQVNPLSFEAFDERARAEAAARDQNEPPAYLLTPEDAKSSTATSLTSEGRGSGSGVRQASSGPVDVSAE